MDGNKIQIFSTGPAPHQTKIYLGEKEILNCIKIEFINDMKTRKVILHLDETPNIDGDFEIEFK